MLLLLSLDGFRSWDGFKQGLDEWAPAAEWGVAIGTIILAWATFRLAKRAKQEAEAVRTESELLTEQVKLQTQQRESSDRPCVYPV